MRTSIALIAPIFGIIVGSAALPAGGPSRPPEVAATGMDQPAPAPVPAPVAPIPPAPPPPPPPPEPPTAAEALTDGVLIVVSLDSQKMFVFKDGELWDTSRVSTGRRGHRTPTGTFPILQKKVHHRSNLYNNAPMPFMQRLTWDGIALHAGAVPNYPASHGCIRLPRAFAQKLYRITNFTSTIVVVTDREVENAEEARTVV